MGGGRPSQQSTSPETYPAKSEQFNPLLFKIRLRYLQKLNFLILAVKIMEFVATLFKRQLKGTVSSDWMGLNERPLGRSL